MPPIHAPLPDIAVHVVESPAISPLLPYRMRFAATVFIIPRYFVQIRTHSVNGCQVLPVIQSRYRTRAAGIFPLRLGWQRKDLSCCGKVVDPLHETSWF